MTFFSFLVFFPDLNQTAGTLDKTAAKVARRKSKWKSCLTIPGESWMILCCQRSLRRGLLKKCQRAAQRSSFNVKQSAEQLDVKKNVLLNGFDSSTEDQPFFKLTDHKKIVAPFPVKG
jgi:hypothetical protein